MSSSRATRTRSLIGVIAAMAVVNLVYGITFPLLALVLDQQGISKTLIGLSTITQALAIFAIAPYAPRMLIWFNPARIMQVSAVALALLFILTGLWQNVYFWFPLRFVIGVFTALLWIASEALVNELATEEWRGRVVGIYASLGAAGFALGPLLLILTGSSGFLPFLTTSVMVLVSALPLWMVQGVERGHEEVESAGLWVVFRLAPVIMIGNIIYAASVESMITFFPLFGMYLGLTESYSLSLMSIMALGGMVLILPLGWLADKVNRMGMLAVCIALAAAALVVMPAMVQAPGWLAVSYVFLFGGVEGMIYTLGVALIGQRFKGAALASATTTFTACWGAGTIIGPLASGVVMDRLGAGTLTWIAAVFFLLYLPLPVVSYLRGKRLGMTEPGTSA